MLWFVIVISAYFFGAIANILDKFLLGSKRISSAPVYAFYMGLFGAGAFLLAPFGLKIPGGNIFFLCILSGLIFSAGILLLFFAFKKSEASRVAPVVGSVVPVATFALSVMLGTETLLRHEIAGVFLLIFGGLLISFDLPLKLKKNKLFAGFSYSCAAGILLAIAYMLFKNISDSEDFISWYIWTRMGGVLGAAMLLMIPAWRESIFRSFHHAKKSTRQVFTTSFIFVGNKIFGGLSTLLLNFAIGLGSVTLTNALVPVQYVFVLLIAALLSTTHAHVFEEKLYFWDWVQKIAAIAIIAVGIILLGN